MMAAAAALVAGIILRLVLGGDGVGDRSAAVMSALLGCVVWTATMLLSGPRGACFSLLGLMLLLDLAALPARNMPEFDDREALFTTDQVVSTHLPTPGSTAAVLTLLVEPVYAGAQPQFILAGEVGSVPIAWECAWERGRQRLALPLPAQLPASASVDLRLHLTGAPSRESDYLLVYASSLRGGPLLAFVGPADVPADATRCSAT